MSAGEAPPETPPRPRRLRLRTLVRALRSRPSPPPGLHPTFVSFPPIGEVVVSEPPGPGLPQPGHRRFLEVGPAGHAAFIAQAAGVFHMPRLGVVIDRRGRVHEQTAGEARAKDPTLESFHYFGRRAGRLIFCPPDVPPMRGAATVWMPHGANYNYGHFLLDALPALLAAEEAGAFADFPPIAPPLNRWQAQLLALAYPDLVVTQTAAQVEHIDRVVYASCMDHFLHTPTPLLGRLRDRLLAAAPRAGGERPRRLYLSRRGWSMRVMVNDRELEAALVSRGFTIVQPEALSPAEQIDLMREAQIVVAPTGAAMANVLFAPPEARVIEIQPLGFGDGWVRRIREVIGARPVEVWTGVQRAAPPLASRLRLGFQFAYRTDVEGLIRSLDAG